MPRMTILTERDLRALVPLDREAVDSEGRTVSHVTDETTNRGFWRHLRAVMTES